MALTGFGGLLVRSEERFVPLSVLVELTGRCNLRCKHCYLDLDHPPKELYAQRWCSLIDELVAEGTLFFTLSGGEMFLRKDALTIARHARQRGLALRLFTNATRIDRELAAEIAKVAPMAVEVSVYGSHGVHDDVTARRGTFRRTLRGIVLLRRLGVRVGIKAPIMSLDASEVDALLRLGERLGCRVALDPILHVRRDGNTAPALLRASVDALAEVMRKPGVGFIEKPLASPPDADDAPCAVAKRVCRIGPAGDVFPCSSFPVPAGNIAETSFADVWRHAPLLQKLRAVRVSDLQGDCQGCGKMGYCGRCLASAFTEHGTMLGPDREACRVAEAKELAKGVPVGPLGGGRSRHTRLPVIA